VGERKTVELDRDPLRAAEQLEERAMQHDRTAHQSPLK
jgi:hypothetical protein